MTPLTSPTKRQIVWRNCELAKELINNKRKGTGMMRNYETGGRCCLQVAEDLAIRCGLPISRSHLTHSEPPEEVGQFFGWGSPNPELKTPHDEEILATELNDGVCGSRQAKHKYTQKGLSHKEIAECFLNTFTTTKPKWSFTIRADAKD